MSERNSDKNIAELTGDTALNGFLGGIKVGVGVVESIATLGTRTKTLEDGYEKTKKSAKGGFEMGRRVRRKLG
jgi:hypothetical protein